MAFSFKKNKDKDKEMYLTYLNGDIFEEERTRRKELHEGDNALSVKTHDEVTEEDLIHDYKKNTEDKMKHTSENGFLSKKVIKFLLAGLFCLFFFVCVQLLSTYTLEIFGPKTQITLSPVEQLTGTLTDKEAEAKPVKEKKPFFLDSVKDKFTEYIEEHSPISSGTTSEGEKIPSISDIDATGMKLSAETHEYTIQTTNSLKQTISLFVTNRTNRIALNNKAKFIEESTALQIERIEADESESAQIKEMKEILLKRLNHLSELAVTMQVSERSEMVTVANDSIELENTENARYQLLFKNTLDYYGVPYTETENKIIY